MARRRDAKGLLHFTVRRKVQQSALDRFGDRPRKPLDSVPLRSQPPTSLVDYLRRDRRDQATFRRISRNSGKRLVDRTQKRTQALGLIDTRLLISSWRYTLVDRSETGLTADVQLRNDAPYTLYVHPKGTPRQRTFVKVDLPPITREVQEELAVGQGEFMAVVGARVAADIVRRAIVDATVGGG